MAERVSGLLNRHPAVGLAAAVVRDGELDFFAGHGVSDLESNRPVAPDTIFRVASITKTFTAIGVMQLWERGMVDLDAPVSHYLRAYRLRPARADFGPVTLRHLLTHTSGIGETVHPAQVLAPDFGESVAPGRPLTSLAEYYRGALRVQADPGTRWTYTDHGFATAGQVIEDVTGTSLPDYLRANVFEPLGMTDTNVEAAGLPHERVATGYTLAARGPRAVARRELVTVGASNANSTTTDMTRYLVALLGGGANKHGSVLRPETLAAMYAPHYQPDPRLPGMGLGFFRQDIGGHQAVEHQGILPGFNSQIWLAPDAGIGVMVFLTGAARATMWLPAATAGLLAAALGVPEPEVRADIPHHPEIWHRICGRYRVAGALADVRSRLAVGAGADIRIRAGVPVLRILTPVPALLRGLPLRPDDPADPYAFRIDLSAYGIGSARIVFTPEGGGVAAAMRTDLLPMTLHRTGH